MSAHDHFDLCKNLGGDMVFLNNKKVGKRLFFSSWGYIFKQEAASSDYFVLIASFLPHSFKFSDPCPRNLGGIKGPAHSKNEIYIFYLQPKTKRMQPICMTPTEPVFFWKLLTNGPSHDTKIGSIRLVWAGAKK